MLKKTKENSDNIEKFMSAPSSIRRGADRKVVNIQKRKAPLKSEVRNRLHKISFSKKNILSVILVVIFIGALGTAGYFYYQYKKATAVDASKNEIVNYTAKISKFMVLPSGETPTMATVADKDKLASQSFFAHAENGDKVLFYSKAQKAILYRPATNMIIEASSMAASANVPDTQNTQNTSGNQVSAQANSEPQAVAQTAPEAQNPPTEAVAAPKMTTVAIYNGTFQKGLAASISSKLAAITEIKIASTGNAKGNYTKTTVIDLTGNNADAAKKVADTLGGEIGSLPDGENKPANADIMIIGGSDFKN